MKIKALHKMFDQSANDVNYRNVPINLRIEVDVNLVISVETILGIRWNIFETLTENEN